MLFSSGSLGAPTLRPLTFPRWLGLLGAAWVFTRSGSTWSQQGSKLLPNDESGEGEFGDSVALSANGANALVGGPGAA